MKNLKSIPGNEDKVKIVDGNLEVDGEIVDKNTFFAYEQVSQTTIKMSMIIMTKGCSKGGQKSMPHDTPPAWAGCQRILKSADVVSMAT